eukprot:879101_1
MSVQLDVAGNGVYVDINTGWTGDLNHWPSISTKTITVPNLNGNIRIKCVNDQSHGCVSGNPGGLLFSLTYQGQFYNTNGNNGNNGFYELVESLRGGSSVLDPGYPWGKTLNGADWTFTCPRSNVC